MCNTNTNCFTLLKLKYYSSIFIYWWVLKIYNITKNRKRMSKFLTVLKRL